MPPPFKRPKFLSLSVPTNPRAGTSAVARLAFFCSGFASHFRPGTRWPFFLRVPPLTTRHRVMRKTKKLWGFAPPLFKGFSFLRANWPFPPSFFFGPRVWTPPQKKSSHYNGVDSPSPPHTEGSALFLLPPILNMAFFFFFFHFALLPPCMPHLPCRYSIRLSQQNRGALLGQGMFFTFTYDSPFLLPVLPRSPPPFALGHFVWMY